MIGDKLKDAINFVYQSYRPEGLSSIGVTCWRCGMMSDIMIALCKYYGYEAKRENVVIQGEGHVIARVETPAGSVFVDTSVEQFGKREGPIWGLGKHPDAEVTAC